VKLKRCILKAVFHSHHGAYPQTGKNQIAAAPADCSRQFRHDPPHKAVEERNRKRDISVGRGSIYKKVRNLRSEGLTRGKNPYIFKTRAERRYFPCLRQLDLINDRAEPWYRQLGVMEIAAAA
jgi:hypothetical protein